jgi:hypothetical protein
MLAYFAFFDFLYHFETANQENAVRSELADYYLNAAEVCVYVFLFTSLQWLSIHQSINHIYLFIHYAVLLKLCVCVQYNDAVTVLAASPLVQAEVSAAAGTGGVDMLVKRLDAQLKCAEIYLQV